MKVKIKNESIYLFLFILLALIIRIVLSFLPGFQVDMSAWYAWSNRLINLGFNQFYHPQIWTHYTPGYLYILWILGVIKKNIFLGPGLILQLFKLPNNLADILTGLLIYKIVGKKSKPWAVFGVIFYLFNPALIFNSSVWGQADSFLTLLMLIAFYFLIDKGKVYLSALFLAFSFLVKPQAVFIFPIMTVFLIRNYKFDKVLRITLVFLTTVFLLAFPFFTNDPILGLPKMIIQMGKDYAYTTLGAFNFWWLFGSWQRDSTLFLGLTKHYIGLIIYLLIEAAIVVSVWRGKNQKKEAFYLAATLSLFNFFLFPTRIHERYLLSTLPFLLITGTVIRSLTLVVAYIFLSLLHFINLFYIYNYYYPEFIKIPILNSLTKLKSLPIAICFLTIVIFLTTFYFYLKCIGKKIIKKKSHLNQFLNKRIKAIFYKKESKLKVRVKKLKLKRFKKAKKYLILILLFNVFLRVWNLWHPAAYIFDEVYHGFTAQEMAKGNVMAWEWWNTPPKGFAYEWTHPPLAKLLMTSGIFLFGKNDQVSQYAFRFPAVIFGVGVVYLTYLLALEIFKKEKIALFSAILISFDGLLFVMSRIGMADVYFLFFLLLTIYLALKQKYAWSGVCLGLSIATKWTGIYLYPVIGAILISKLFKNQVCLSSRLNQDCRPPKNRVFTPYFLHLGGVVILSFVLIPMVVYLLVYTPFFTSGHSWEKFLELQRQMWGYHTNLKATHNYQSQAWSWPLMLRPVWFWVNYKGDKIANIYNLGNPAIWWIGLLILPVAIWKAIKASFFSPSRSHFVPPRRCLKSDTSEEGLPLVVFCYFAFWLPWLFSPRIMFLHHYLPAIPFLCILIAWFLDKIKKELFVISYLLFVILSFSFFYPIYTGLLIPRKFLDFIMWLPSWR